MSSSSSAAESTQGLNERGAKFSASMDNAFRFGAEGYPIANKENALQAFVRQLAAATHRRVRPAS